MLNRGRVGCDPRSCSRLLSLGARLPGSAAGCAACGPPSSQRCCRPGALASASWDLSFLHLFWVKSLGGGKEKAKRVPLGCSLGPLAAVHFDERTAFAEQPAAPQVHCRAEPLNLCKCSAQEDSGPSRSIGQSVSSLRDSSVLVLRASCHLPFMAR